MKLAVVMVNVADIYGGRTLVFDFDGTLVDFNPIKWRAFEVCFAEFPERSEESGGLPYTPETQI